jgi:serine/threonine protein kinase
MRKNFTEAQMCTVLMQTLSPLVSLRTRGIVHRYLKPENILFCKANSDEFKVIDFRPSEAILATGNFLKNCIGRSYYFAPQLKQKM